MNKIKFLENKNFLENQNYIKPKNFNKKFHNYKIFSYLIINIFFSILFSLISLFLMFILIIINPKVINAKGFIFIQGGNYLYFNDYYVFYYFFIFLSLLIFFFVRKNFFYKIDGKKEYNFKNIDITTKKILKILYILLGGIFFIYLFNFIFYILNNDFFIPNILSYTKILIIGSSILFFSSLPGIFFFTKHKIYFKKPSKNIFFNFFERKNLILEVIKSKKIDFNLLRKYFIFIILPIIFFVYQIFYILKYQNFYSSPLKKNIVYSLYNVFSLKLNNFVIGNKLDLSNKNLYYNSVRYVFDYIEKNKIKRLDIQNNFTFLVYPYEIKEYINISKNNFKNKKLDQINYGNIKKYTSYMQIKKKYNYLYNIMNDNTYSNFFKFKNDYDLIKKYLANKVVIKFDRNNKFLFDYNFSKVNEFKRLYYNLNEKFYDNKYNNIKLDLKNISTDKIKILEKILKQKKLFKNFKGKIIFLNISDYYKKEFTYLKYINNKIIFYK